MMAFWKHFKYCWCFFQCVRNLILRDRIKFNYHTTGILLESNWQSCILGLKILAFLGQIANISRQKNIFATEFTKFFIKNYTNFVAQTTRPTELPVSRRNEYMLLTFNVLVGSQKFLQITQCQPTSTVSSIGDSTPLSIYRANR